MPLPSDRKNILFLMTDHTNAAALDPDGQCLTPNLDALAADGRRFHRCYTTNAICSPARASLMTALYPSTHGMWDCTHTQRPEWVDVPADRCRYFSQNLADAGYRNGYFGKWHVEQSQRLEDFGWHVYDGSCAGTPAGTSVPGSEVVVPKHGYRDYLLADTQQRAEPPTHPAVDRGIAFIQDHLAHHPDQPFCCFVSSIEPHDPYRPPQEYVDRYDLDAVELPATLRETGTGIPEVVQRMRAVWEGLDDHDWRRVSVAYWAMISFLDDQMGRLITLLKETGQYDNTIIVFTSDHGDMLGAHGLATKGIGTAYEEVYNIPLIIRVPGCPAGIEDHGTLTSLVDVGPTLLDRCGALPLPDAQGKSLGPVLEQAAQPAEWQDAYAEFFGQRFVYTQRIVWHNEWKYVFSPGGRDELYNLTDDPAEAHNLADDPAARPHLLAMCKRMWQKMRDIGDDSLFNTQYATLRTAPVGPGILDDETVG